MSCGTKLNATRFAHRDPKDAIERIGTGPQRKDDNQRRLILGTQKTQSKAPALAHNAKMTRNHVCKHGRDAKDII